MADLKAIDISETALFDFDAEIMETLLTDHTTHRNIMWCTDDYAVKGEGYSWGDEITIEKITGENGQIIRPRALKSKEAQKGRTRDKAEVFTPSWICNVQNNLIDSAWFGREEVFNIENRDKSWSTKREKVTFPEGKTWKDYVRDTRLEITCGEAPYLASRYDTTTGEYIPIGERIGLLDRKLRVVGENVDDHEEWLKWVQTAYKNVYGYEWQGDSLLIARETLLQTFLDYHSAKFGEDYPLQMKSIRYIAYIISWNLWQMDGLKGVIPNSCHCKKVVNKNLFDTKVETVPCKGCKTRDFNAHNGIYTYIMDWDEGHPIKFVSLIKDK